MAKYVAVLQRVLFVGASPTQFPLLQLRFEYPYRAPDRAMVGLECEENDEPRLRRVAAALACCAEVNDFMGVKYEHVELTLSRQRVLTKIKFQRTGREVDLTLLFDDKVQLTDGKNTPRT